MALFQRQTNTSTNSALYTIGLSKTVLIVGLGNIGNKYKNTLHNIGFECIESFVYTSNNPNWLEKKDLKCQVASLTLSDTRVLVIKPTTYMNLSGEAVQLVTSFYKIPTDHIVVVYDELDIPFGQVRVRVGGSSAGHNGVKSIIEHVGEGFGRIRIGAGPKAVEEMDAATYVLSKFTTEQEKHLDALKNEVTAILTEYIFGGSLSHETRSFIT